MAYDAKLTLSATLTSTASVTATGVDLVTGTGKEGLTARFVATTVGGTSPTFTPVIQHSDDNTTYTALASSNPVSLTAAGIAEVRFSTPKRYVRAVATIGGTSPSIVWYAEVGPLAGVFVE